MATVWHIRVNGMPACACWLLPENERLDPPFCRSRERARLEAHAALLVERHPELEVEVATGGCNPSGE